MTQPARTRPGAANRTDQNPLADGAAALGGPPHPMPAPDARNAALVNHATRYGGTPAIRQTLAGRIGRSGAITGA